MSQLQVSRTAGPTMIALLLALSAPPEVRAEAVRTIRLSPPVQSAAAGERLPAPLAFRVERANGSPVPGLILNVSVNQCIPFATPPPGWSCPEPAEYGGFDPVADLGINLITDANGIATTPQFRNGVPSPTRPNFEFEVNPYVPAQVTASGFDISLNEAVHPLGTAAERNTLVQVAVGGGVVAVPTMSQAGLALLALVLCGGALFFLRRR